MSEDIRIIPEVRTIRGFRVLKIAGPFTRALFFRYVLINVTTYTINFYEERNYYGKKIIYIRICY